MNKRLTIIVNIALGIIIAEKMNMKRITKRSKLNKVLRKLKSDSIVPFKEKPSDNVTSAINKDKKKEMDASELFSFFTADIIKEDVEFVR